MTARRGGRAIRIGLCGALAITIVVEVGALGCGRYGPPMREAPRKETPQSSESEENGESEDEKTRKQPDAEERSAAPRGVHEDRAREKT
jgi:hypothetical protein